MALWPWGSGGLPGRVDLLDTQNDPLTAAPVTGRRRFLGLLAGGAAVLGGAGLFWRLLLPSPLDAKELTLLRRAVDHLVPRGHAPGALDLGIDRGVAEALNATRQFRRLARLGLAWLDDAAGERSDWEHAFLSCLAQPTDVPPRIFFQWLRNEPFGRYYADPRSWAGLSITHPPQPMGYPDYRSAPGAMAARS